MYIHFRLIVVSRAEYLATPGRDGGVAINDLSHYAAQGFHPQRQRSHVKQYDILEFAGQNTGLDCRANGNDLVRIDALVRVFAGQGPYHLLHCRNPGRTADQNDFGNIFGSQLGVSHCLFHRFAATVHQSCGQIVKLRPAQFRFEMLRPRCIGGNERQTDRGFHYRRQFHLGFFRCFRQALQRLFICSKVYSMRLFELISQPVDENLIEIIAAQVRVAAGRFYLEHAIAHF